MTHIHLEKQGAVGILTIHRIERFNSFDVDTARDFRRAGLQLARDETVRCAVVRGSGGVFCSGADLKSIRAGGEESELAYLQQGRRPGEGYGEVFQQILEYLHSTISEIRRAPKPFIAAVDGVAAAGGFGIAMACDLVLASQRATFEWAYHKSGLTGAESSTFLLPKLLGLRRALGLVLLNPRLDATKALELGLINEIYDVEGFDERVVEVAAQIAAGPTRAYAVTKSLINQSCGVGQLDRHLDLELEELARIADGDDFREGLDAFFAKRTALFAGKG
jgi:2-(1,2-epoxy-1,2-dihydrophenyl)acetyl-CoA isomerase